MEARLIRAASIAVAVVLTTAAASLAAGYRTTNFIVEAPTKELAEEIGKNAEKYRHDLAIEWLGQPMANWSQPCPITAKVAENLGAGGATSFMFDHGEVFGWRMNIQGNHERILDSVLPHEVTHTIFATHFRRPLPRWADEGACTTVEHESEKAKQQALLINFLKTGRGIAFSQMFAMKDYPPDVLPLYAQGFSLARFLLDQGGKQRYLEFVGAGLKNDDWPSVTHEFYGFANLGELQTAWLDWVKQGSPRHTPAVRPNDAGQFVSNRHDRPEPNLIYRAQGDDRAQSAPRRGPMETVQIQPTDFKARDTKQLSVYERAMAGQPIELASAQSPAEPRSPEVDRRPPPPPADAGTMVAVNTPAAVPPGDGQTAARPRILLEWSRK